MKLYRGLRGDEFIKFTPEIKNKLHTGLTQILTKRNSGDLNYPNHLNKLILETFKIHNLIDQHFTDNKKIALRYAGKKSKRILLEVDVPIEDILKYFTVEFQNFPKRRKSFDIIYHIKGADLVHNAKKWKLLESKL